jgi:glutamate-1-semialdehyde aminotransferase
MFVSAAHTDADLDRTVAAAGEVFKAAAERM